MIKKNINIQTGANISDKYEIEMPSFDTINAITEKKEVQVLSKTYDVDVKVPGMSNIKGELTLDLRENSDVHNFHINYRNQQHEGVLKFKNKNKGDFNLQWGKGICGIELTGELSLNKDSDSSNITGINTYKMDKHSGGWVSTVSFNLKSQETKIVNYEDKKDVSLLNLADVNIKDVLSGDFIEKNILNPLSKARTQIGIQERTLESRLKMQVKSEELNSKALSNIEDLDIAKEMMHKVKKEMLLETNISLFSQNLDSHRNYIVQLLR